MAYRFKQRAQFHFPSIHEELIIFDAELAELTGIHQVPKSCHFRQKYCGCYFQQASEATAARQSEEPLMFSKNIACSSVSPSGARGTNQLASRLSWTRITRHNSMLSPRHASILQIIHFSILLIYQAIDKELLPKQ